MEQNTKLKHESGDAKSRHSNVQFVVWLYLQYKTDYSAEWTNIFPPPFIYNKAFSAGDKPDIQNSLSCKKKYNLLLSIYKIKTRKNKKKKINNSRSWSFVVKAMGMIYVALFLCLSVGAFAEDPYVFNDWKVTYGTIAPLGVPQQGILINGQFPGPQINCTSNNNIYVNVFNELDEPLLITFAGVQHRKNSWQDGTLGTMCPIAPGTNYTFRFQVKDQIGSYFYFPTTALHRAAGGIGMLKIHSRELIPVPFDAPADDFSVLLGDWYNKGHKTLKKILDSGRSIGTPDGIQNQRKVC